MLHIVVALVVSVSAKNTDETARVDRTSINIHTEPSHVECYLPKLA